MGGLKSKASVSPAKTSQRAGRRTTPLKFHLLWHPLQVPPPGSMNAPHCKPGTPSSARSPAYCRCREQSGHTGAAETRPRQQGVPVSLRTGVGRRKMGQMGQGHGGVLGADGGRRVVTCLLTPRSGHVLNSLSQATVVSSFISLVYSFASAHLPFFVSPLLLHLPSFSLFVQPVNWT